MYKPVEEEKDSALNIQQGSKFNNLKDAAKERQNSSVAVACIGEKETSVPW